MAFNTFQVLINRGKANCQASETNIVNHTYVSTTDTMATITTAGYFPDYLNASSEEVKIGDQITIKASDDVQVYDITGVSPLTLTSSFSGLSVIGSTHSTTWGGAFSTPVSASDIGFRQVGSIVVAHFPEFFATADVAATINATSPLPVNLRPASNLDLVIEVTNAASEQRGIMTITTAGAMTVGSDKPLLPFTGSGNTGVWGFSASWFTL